MCMHLWGFGKSVRLGSYQRRLTAHVYAPFGFWDIRPLRFVRCVSRPSFASLFPSLDLRPPTFISPHTKCSDKNELLNFHNAASQRIAFEDDTNHAKHLEKICQNSFVSTNNHVGSKISQRERMESDHWRYQEYDIALANCVYKDDRNRRRENERVTSVCSRHFLGHFGL